MQTISGTPEALFSAHFDTERRPVDDLEEAERLLTFLASMSAALSKVHGGTRTGAAITQHLMAAANAQRREIVRRGLTSAPR